MGTRGAVGVGNEREFVCLYNHFDSYPVGLGRDVWDEYQNRKMEGTTLAQFCEELLRYDDWRAFLREGICQYCGKKDTQPHSIGGVVFQYESAEKLEALKKLPWYHEPRTDAEREAEENFKKFGFADPDRKWHQHSDGSPEDNQMTNETVDPLFIEWMYIFNLEKNCLYVFGHREAKGKGGYEHYLVTTLDLDGPEPNWDKMEEEARG